MLYRQDIAGCLASAAGNKGLTDAELDAALQAATPSLRKLARLMADGSLPLLALPARRDDLAALKPVAASLRRLKDVIVLGTGGSSLGGQTLAELALSLIHI